VSDPNGSKDNVSILNAKQKLFMKEDSTSG
jgi:hypothetical protein